MPKIFFIHAKLTNPCRRLNSFGLPDRNHARWWYAFTLGAVIIARKHITVLLNWHIEKLAHDLSKIPGTELASGGMRL